MVGVALQVFPNWIEFVYEIKLEFPAFSFYEFFSRNCFCQFVKAFVIDQFEKFVPGRKTVGIIAVLMFLASNVNVGRNAYIQRCIAGVSHDVYPRGMHLEM